RRAAPACCSRPSASPASRPPPARRSARRNCDQLGPIRRGAGPRPARRSTLAPVVAETPIPSPFSSPWMRLLPQLGFSRASCSIRLRISAASGGRPTLRGAVRLPRSSARCQRPSVCALTRKHEQRSRASSRLAAASKARSLLVYRGRLPPRLRIASCWRSTMISSSCSPARRTSRPRTARRSRYRNDTSTTQSLNRPLRDHQHPVPGEPSFFTPDGVANELRGRAEAADVAELGSDRVAQHPGDPGTGGQQAHVAVIGPEPTQRPLLRGDLLVEDLDQRAARLQTRLPRLGQLQTRQQPA